MRIKDFYNYENLETFNTDKQLSWYSAYDVLVPDGDPITITIDLSLSFIIKVNFHWKEATIYFKNAKPGNIYWLIVLFGKKLFFRHGNNIYLRQSGRFSYPSGYSHAQFSNSLLLCTPRDKNSVYLDLLVSNLGSPWSI